MSTSNTLPTAGYVRLPQIIGQKEVTPEQAAANRETGKGPKTAQPGIPAVIPISRAGWYNGIAKGLYPAPVKLSERVAAWPVESIRALMTAPAAA